MGTFANIFIRLWVYLIIQSHTSNQINRLFVNNCKIITEIKYHSSTPSESAKLACNCSGLCGLSHEMMPMQLNWCIDCQCQESVSPCKFTIVAVLRLQLSFSNTSSLHIPPHQTMQFRLCLPQFSRAKI